MTEINIQDSDAILQYIKEQAKGRKLRITVHAHQEMVEENLNLSDVLEAIARAVILENYPEHKRGPCCLLYGNTTSDRPVHLVATSSQPVLVLITVYEPKPPKWLTPTQRGEKL